MRYVRQKPIPQVNYADFNKYQPCWTCKNACGGCSWSREAKPINGWEAEKTFHPSNGEHAESYYIKSCPEYERG